MVADPTVHFRYCQASFVLVVHYVDQSAVASISHVYLTLPYGFAHERPQSTDGGGAAVAILAVPGRQAGLRSGEPPFMEAPGRASVNGGYFTRFTQPTSGAASHQRKRASLLTAARALAFQGVSGLLRSGRHPHPWLREPW